MPRQQHLPRHLAHTGICTSTLLQTTEFSSSPRSNTFPKCSNFKTPTRPVMSPSDDELHFNLNPLHWDSTTHHDTSAHHEDSSSSNDCFDQVESPERSSKSASQFIMYDPQVTHTDFFDPLGHHQTIAFAPIRTSASVPNDNFDQVQEVLNQSIDFPKRTQRELLDQTQALEDPSNPQATRKISRTGFTTSTKIEGHRLSSTSWLENADAEQIWAMQFKRLTEFKRKTNHCSVPARYNDDPKLGHWVMTQRRQYHLMKKGTRTRMTSTRIDQLEQLGFQWSVRPNSAEIWTQRLGELKDYKKLHGDCLVPQRYASNPQLGTW